jgi:hypothetical protein
MTIDFIIKKKAFGRDPEPRRAFSIECVGSNKNVPEELSYFSNNTNEDPHKDR